MRLAHVDGMPDDGHLHEDLERETLVEKAPVSFGSNALAATQCSAQLQRRVGKKPRELEVEKARRGGGMSSIGVCRLTKNR